jgi:hypothetical protein
VQRVTVTEKASGVYVEPVVARAPAAATVDSSTVRTQQP